MATWQCTQCGFEKEARCKPRKCPACEAKEAFTKKETPVPESKAK